MSRRIRMRPQDCLRCRRYSGPRHHRSIREFARIHLHCIPRDRLCARKCMLRHRRHRAVHIPICIRHIVDCGVVIDDRRVVDVRDGCLVDSGVRYVHPVHISRAYAIRGNIHFARAERKPCNVLASARTTSHEYHQRGRIYWTRFDRPRNPSPAPVNVDPSSVMKRRISPRRIVDPSPSPRIDPCPVPVMIWSPSRFHARIPDVSILWICLPVAVLVEIFESDNLLRAIVS